jgi:hypothetical protein
MDGHHLVFDMFVISAVVFLILRLFGRPIRLMRIMVTVVFIAILVLPPAAPYLGITGLPFDEFPMFLGARPDSHRDGQLLHGSRLRRPL